MYIAYKHLTYKYYRESHLYSNFYVLCFKLKLPYSVTSRGSSWLQTCLCSAWSQWVWDCGGKITSKGNWRSHFVHHKSSCEPDTLWWETAWVMALKYQFWHTFYI